jgi:hypothetical protein
VVKYPCWYLLATKDKGIILLPVISKSFEVHVDCDFAGNWVPLLPAGHIISYAGCPIIWAFKLQIKMVLSTTKSECVGLLESIRIEIVMMNILKETKEQGVNLPKTMHVVY